jgi:hypothetical protein
VTVPISDDNLSDDVLITPEGDNETDPGAPLSPSDAVMEIPPGYAPDPAQSEHKPKGIEKFIDEVVRGEYM